MWWPWKCVIHVSHCKEHSWRMAADTALWISLWVGYQALFLLAASIYSREGWDSSSEQLWVDDPHWAGWSILGTCCGLRFCFYLILFPSFSPFVGGRPAPQSEGPLHFLSFSSLIILFHIKYQLETCNELTQGSSERSLEPSTYLSYAKSSLAALPARYCKR